jgi:hypothetical protein
MQHEKQPWFTWDLNPDPLAYESRTATLSYRDVQFPVCQSVGEILLLFFHNILVSISLHNDIRNFYNGFLFDEIGEKCYKISFYYSILNFRQNTLKIEKISSF